jgi:hypothetical protein
MPRRLSRRLVGWLAIELLLGAADDRLLSSATRQATNDDDLPHGTYKSGTAQTGRVQALALSDRHGRVAVIAQAEFAVPQSVSDMVAVEVMKAHRLERGDVLIRSATGNPACVGFDCKGQLLEVIEAAMGALEPARLLSDGTVVSAFAGGTCRASVSRDGALAFERCAGGRPLRGGIRSAFQTVEPEHGLLPRGATPPAFSVQALVLGKGFAIVCARGADGNPSTDPGAEAAVRRVLARVR